MIGNSLLTNEQETFLNILSNVGCMSKEQAIHIMKDYLGMRTNSVNAAITAFCTLWRSQMRFRAVALRSITAARF